jgi:hypothetical protein
MSWHNRQSVEEIFLATFIRKKTFSSKHMNEFDSAILVALISAVSAIIVALINCYGLIKINMSRSRKREREPSREMKSPTLIKLGDNEKCWIMIMFIFLPWIIVSSIFYGWFVGLFNVYILIPVVTVVLVIVKPIKLGTVVFSVLAIHSLNLYMTEFAFRYRPAAGVIVLFSSSFRAYYSSLILSGLPSFLVVILGNILIIYAINRYRMKRKHRRKNVNE